MKAYHIACGSDNLDSIIRAKGKRLVKHDLCKHCDRIIESSEIARPSRITVRRVVFDNTVNTKEGRTRVISKCFPRLVT